MFFQPWSKILCLYVLAFKRNNLQAPSTSVKKWKSHYYHRRFKTQNQRLYQQQVGHHKYALPLGTSTGFRMEGCCEGYFICLCTLQPSQYVDSTMAFFGHYCRFLFDQINRTRTDSVTFEGEDVNEHPLPAHSSSELYICIDCATGIPLGSWILVGNFYSKFWAVEGHLGYSVGTNSNKRRESLCPELPILSSSLLPLDFYLAALYCFSTQSLALMSAMLEFFFPFTHLIFETSYYFCDLFGILSISRAFFARQTWYKEKQSQPRLTGCVFTPW